MEATKKNKKPQTMEELLKKQKEERKAMKELEDKKRMAALMVALHICHPGMSDAEIVKFYEAKAEAVKAESAQG